MARRKSLFSFGYSWSSKASDTIMFTGQGKTCWGWWGTLKQCRNNNQNYHLGKLQFPHYSLFHLCRNALFFLLTRRTHHYSSRSCLLSSCMNCLVKQWLVRQSWFLLILRHWSPSPHVLVTFFSSLGQNNWHPKLGKERFISYTSWRFQSILSCLQSG